MASNRELYYRISGAFNRGDLDAAAKLLSPDIEWDYTAAGFEADVRHGPTEVRRLWEQLHHGWSNFSVHIEQAIEAGDRLVIVARYVAEGRTSGARVERRLAELLTFRDGKLLSYRQFETPDEALEAAGGPPEAGPA